jgi:hypothetical protein
LLSLLFFFLLLSLSNADLSLLLHYQLNAILDIVISECLSEIVDWALLMSPVYRVSDCIFDKYRVLPLDKDFNKGDFLL